jgi:hypothetical protein
MITNPTLDMTNYNAVAMKIKQPLMEIRRIGLITYQINHKQFNILTLSQCYLVYYTKRSKIGECGA